MNVAKNIIAKAFFPTLLYVYIIQYFTIKINIYAPVVGICLIFGFAKAWLFPDDDVVVA